MFWSPIAEESLPRIARMDTNEERVLLLFVFIRAIRGLFSVPINLRIYLRGFDLRFASLR
jgi:hypothetical protein